MTQREFDIIILGGGISSSLLALSILKKNADIRILILEKDSEFPQKVGESTSDITALFLRRFGIDHLLKDQVQKTGLRFLFNEKNSSNKENVAEFSSPTFDGPNNGFQINRKVFDEQLLVEAESKGAVVYRPVELINATFEPFSCQLELNYENEIIHVKSKWFVDASGRARYIHHKLKWKDLPVALDTGAIFAHFTNVAEPENWNIPENKYWKENAVGDGSLSTLHFMRKNAWWWLIKIDETTTSIGYVFENEHVNFEDADAFFKAELEKDAQLSAITKGATYSKAVYISKVPYQSEKLYDEGIALIGDSGAFVDPLVSPGIELICQQVLCLTDLLAEDIKSKQFNKKEWDKYSTQFTRAFKDRMEIYKNGYNFMHSYDLSSNWLQLGLLAYFGITVFLAFLYPKRLKIPFTINRFGRLGFYYMIWRLKRINKRRIAQGRDSNAKPNAITYSAFYYPKGIFYYSIPLRMFFRWLWRYLKLEIGELRYIFKKSIKQ